MTGSDGDTHAEILDTLREEIAAQRAAADTETDPAVRNRRRETAAIRDEVAEEEAEAIDAEIAEKKEAALSLRIPQSLSRSLKQRAAAEGVPVSALARRLLTGAITQPGPSSFTLEQIEEIARRVARDEIKHLRDTA